jgi:hemolysin III
MSPQTVKLYPPLEEKINIGSHLLGLVLSVVGTVLLMLQAFKYGNLVSQFAFVVYGLSMMALYAASSVYHSRKTPHIRIRMRVVDHAAIYLLIAGTYTPFMMVTLSGTLGYSILAAAWAMAIIGIVIKIFYTGHFEVLSTVLYILMGWAIVFAIKPLAANLAPAGLFWLLAGGVSYTVGAIIYAIKQVPFNHAIFHVFVLLGSISHFISVYFYVL